MIMVIFAGKSVFEDEKYTNGGFALSVQEDRA